MKTLKLSFSQENTTFEETLQVETLDSLSKVLGTALTRLFDLNAVLRKSSNSYFKATKPVNFIIESDGYTIDSNQISEVFKTKFKFGEKASSKRRFAQRVWAVVDFITSEPETLTITALEQELAEVEKLEK